MNAPTSLGRSLSTLGAVGALLLVLVSSLAAAPAFSEANVAAFTDRYCSSCHNDVDKEGGLDLTSLKYTPDDPANFSTWVKVHDRVQTGEMPPKEKKRPDRADLSAFISGLGTSLTAA